MSGRFAPSPTGPLHLGNLRTALVAWLAARSHGLGFLVRMEDLDTVTASSHHESAQLADLTSLGLDYDAVPVRQSERFDRYRAVFGVLNDRGLVYPCFCTRREVRAEIDAAARAPHVHLPHGAYPGTCRDLSDAQRAQRRSAGRRPAWRLRTDGDEIAVDDVLAGPYSGAVDDVVLVRADQVPAYNLAVVVDDSAQSVTQVVRGDDLLASTPRQILIQRLLGFDTPEYWHVPLVVGDDGQRLAKRHGAVTVAQLRSEGWTTRDVVAVLARSLGLAAPGERPDTDRLVERFDPGSVPKHPITWSELRSFAHG